MIFLVACAAFCATLLGGLFALRLKDRLHLILGFSAGAVIGVAFFDLMPEALQLAGGEHGPAFIMAHVAVGFVVYLLLDRMIVLHHHHEEGGHAHAHNARGVWGASALSLHSFLDGVAIGLSFQVSVFLGIIVAVAVLAHDFSDGINTVSMILKNGGDNRRAVLWLGVDAIAPAFGVVATLFFTVSEAGLGIVLAIFSGFFLYIGASDLLPESHHDHPTMWTTVSTVCGIAFMFLIIHVAQ